MLEALAAIAAGQAGVTSLANLGLDLYNQHYQRGLQQDIFNREDNSIQRRVADLIAAGLSPVLAAGNGASAGSVVPVKSAEVKGLSDSAMLYAQIIGMEKDFMIKDQQLKNLQSQKNLNDINTAIKSWDLGIYKKTGTSSNAGGMAKTIRDFLGMSESPVVEGAAKKINNKIDSVLHTPKRSDYNISEYDKKLRNMSKQERAAEEKRVKDKIDMYYNKMKGGK